MISSETQECLDCHTDIHPGIVASWQNSRHYKITVIDALKKSKLESRVSSTKIDSALLKTTVGCYECHSLNTDKHSDSFEHNGYQINIVVSSDDCAACHEEESDQYSENLMAHAYSNLVDNAVYMQLAESVNNPHSFIENKIVIGKSDSLTNYESCLYCHGTKVEVSGSEIRDTDFGELEFPVLEGWPNQGIGRVNPDGSLGACTSCHPRHDFSIETARKPHTCSECHKGPDVPAYKVYEVSKHGNIYNSKSHEINFENVPWTVGKDFTTPTCAACHVSLIVAPDETVIAERTHKFNDRLAWRLFGVPYAHPHPVNADLSNVKNSVDLPLITELDGTPVSEFVISKEEQEKRNSNMKSLCYSCHSSQWVNNHFERLDNTIERTNELTYEATKVLIELWNNDAAKGLPQKSNIFDEEVERLWTDLWLFHTNSARFTSAMAGGGDYGVYADGRYQATEKLYKLYEKLKQIKRNKQ